MVVGSNPTATTICEGVAQLAEHLTWEDSLTGKAKDWKSLVGSSSLPLLTINQVVESSNLSTLTIYAPLV
mgnify:CR=1 FL=1